MCRNPAKPTRGIQDPVFKTRVLKDSAYFEQTGSDPVYSFIQVSRAGSGFSNFIVLGFDANTITKIILQRFKGCKVVHINYKCVKEALLYRTCHAL